MTLPDRSRGARKHWRKVIPDLAECGARLRDLCPWTAELGDPIEAQEFWHRHSLRRLEAIFPNGRHISLSLHASGHYVYRMKGAT